MIKKGTKVRIITGKDKNKEGEVIEINRKLNRAKVKGINLIKKHVKTTKEKKGGIFSKENFLDISNLVYLDDKKKAEKVKKKEVKNR
ncbi:MAG: 50S ribosomal protein L24 [Candidatus Pelagibacter sp. TMED273]|nr:MAG: 50S ribosomal protein L24 [Candidatus Pelagibacter sp. TMED273]